jgi:uncharacterized protein YqeY
MPLKDRITEDMKTAMRAGEKERLGTIRLILSAVKQREVDERITLDDSQVLAAIEKMISSARRPLRNSRPAAERTSWPRKRPKSQFSRRTCRRRCRTLK